MSHNHENGAEVASEGDSPIFVERKLGQSPGDDAAAIVDRLIRAGMSPAEAQGKGRAFSQVEAELAGSHGAARNLYRLFVPGRIEVLGKHTDYAGGRSLLAAVERGFCIAAAAREDDTVRIVDAACGERSSFQLQPELAPAVGHWSNYPMTVARRVARNFRGPLRGADIALASDLPPAAGMSSSSALMIGIFHVLSHVNGLPQREEFRANIAGPESLAGYLATIENGQNFGSLAGDRGVGTFGGSEDHTAICCCRPGHLHLYAFCPVRQQQVIALPEGYLLAIGSSGLLAEKTGEAMAKYNRASRLVGALLDLWRAETGRDDRCLADAVHSAADAAERLRHMARRGHAGFDGPALQRRLQQFLEENERIIPAAVQALERGAVALFGRCVDQSQQMAEQLLQNQTPETVYLARWARQCGAEAASAFGAGFGGSVWALLKTAAAQDFLAAWSGGYRQAFPVEARRAAFFPSGAGPGLLEIG
ncbi:MAG: galactokinase family protein [Thermoguttaceae bacterium]|jgi:galactokinase